MADESHAGGPPKEPLGFTNHTRSLSGEYAHEQGWGLHEAERTAMPNEKQEFEGGTDYDYGARDFGDTAVDTSAVVPSPAAVEFIKGNQKESD